MSLSCTPIPSYLLLNNFSGIAHHRLGLVSLLCASIKYEWLSDPALTTLNSHLDALCTISPAHRSARPQNSRPGLRSCKMQRIFRTKYNKVADTAPRDFIHYQWLALKWQRQSLLCPQGMGERNPAVLKAQSHSSLSSLGGATPALHSCLVPEKAHVCRCSLQWGLEGKVLSSHSHWPPTSRGQVEGPVFLSSGSFCSCAPREEGHTLLSAFFFSELLSAFIWFSVHVISVSTLCAFCTSRGRRLFPKARPLFMTDQLQTLATELPTGPRACPGYSVVNSPHQFCISCLLPASIGASPRRGRSPQLGLPFLGTFPWNEWERGPWDFREWQWRHGSWDNAQEGAGVTATTSTKA